MARLAGDSVPVPGPLGRRKGLPPAWLLAGAVHPAAPHTHITSTKGVELDRIARDTVRLRAVAIYMGPDGGDSDAQPPRATPRTPPEQYVRVNQHCTCKMWGFSTSLIPMGMAVCRRPLALDRTGLPRLFLAAYSASDCCEVGAWLWLQDKDTWCAHNRTQRYTRLHSRECSHVSTLPWYSSG